MTHQKRGLRVHACRQDDSPSRPGPCYGACDQHSPGCFEKPPSQHLPPVTMQWRAYPTRPAGSLSWHVDHASCIGAKRGPKLPNRLPPFRPSRRVLRPKRDTTKPRKAAVGQPSGGERWRDLGARPPSTRSLPWGWAPGGIAWAARGGPFACPRERRALKKVKAIGRSWARLRELNRRCRTRPANAGLVARDQPALPSLAPPNVVVPRICWRDGDQAWATPLNIRHPAVLGARSKQKWSDPQGRCRLRLRFA